MKNLQGYFDSLLEENNTKKEFSPSASHDLHTFCESEGYNELPA